MLCLTLSPEQFPYIARLIFLMAIQCQNCGLVNDFNERQSGPHTSAYCNGCGKYIKHLPKSNNTIIYFGKYKGRELSSLRDYDEIRYLTWLTNAGGIKEKLKQAIDAHLRSL